MVDADSKTAVHNGHIYVLEANRGQITTYSADGRRCLGCWKHNFVYPVAFAMSGSGHSFVADAGVQRIQVLDEQHAFLGNLSCPHSMWWPGAVPLATDRSGNLFVLNNDGTLEAWQNDGTHLMSFRFHEESRACSIAIADDGRVFVGFANVILILAFKWD